MSRTQIVNILHGVKDGFEKKLEINGVGYRAAMQGKNLQLALGFSHDVVYQTPQGITIAAPKPTEITVTGIDKQQVGQVAAEIRKYPRARALQGQGRAVRWREDRPQRRQEEVRPIRQGTNAMASKDSTSAAPQRVASPAQEGRAAAGRACRCTVRRRTSMPRSSTTPRAVRWPPLRRSTKDLKPAPEDRRRQPPLLRPSAS